MASFSEFMRRLGAVKTVGPVIDYSFEVVNQREFEEQSGDSPHGRPWHTSFHASSFPGDSPRACGRYAMYGLMDIPKQDGGTDRWLESTAEAGKSIELHQVRKVRDAGFLVQSLQPGRSSDPDALTPEGKPMPQMGFVDHEHWLTGSVDMPLLPFNYRSPHIVEIKTKHESKIDEMLRGERQEDEKHRRQVLCSLGLAHKNPDAFGHPQTGEPLAPARDGSILYLARDTPWPGPVKEFEFFFEYSPEFMEAGFAYLKSWKKSFLDEEMPQTVQRKNSRSHPFGWKWSEGLCKYCELKKICKTDYENAALKLGQSVAIEVVQNFRPDYDYREKRQTVLDAWKDEPVAASGPTPYDDSSNPFLTLT